MSRSPAPAGPRHPGFPATARRSTICGSGLRQAVFAVNGRISPTLDLTASLSDLPADLAASRSRRLTASGTIAAKRAAHRHAARTRTARCA